jgi:Tol biopolymer transport system component/DNA-binding winged helix-turn-helix (wHTH) protein
MISGNAVRQIFEDLRAIRGFTPQQFHFADFTLDESRYRLQRGEDFLRLEKRPMELLILLLQRRGELVTRDEIAGRLWGKEVFLDVDHSINTAIRKIRVVLRDDPEKPRFVETVVGKGYRFSAAVTFGNGEASTAAGPERAGASTEVGSHPQAESKTESKTESKAADRSVRSTLVGLALIAAVALAVVVGLWLQRRDYFWQSEIARARFQVVTDFDGIEQAAAVSRDGRFVAFLSNRDGPMDVWVSQAGSGAFHNLTHGSAPELVNSSIRTLGFSPDGSMVTFWARKPEGDIGIWAVPTLGGQPRPYLEGAAEYDWSQDGTRLAYHTPGPGDPLFVSEGVQSSGGRPIFTAPAGLHCHFPLWAPDGRYIYFVLGSLPDKLDIWRIAASGGVPERITSHNSRVSYPVFLDRRKLLYLAGAADGSGPWLYSMDVERRVAHRLSSGVEQYTSLAASADGHRLVATLASPKTSLWRLPIAGAPGQSAPTQTLVPQSSAPKQIPLTTGAGFSPRLGPGYLLYVAASGSSDSIWKLGSGSAAELWSSHEARVAGGPVISRDGGRIAFSVRQQGKTLLFVMQGDGTNARVVTDALDLRGTPAWSPDGQSIIASAENHGVPHLLRIALDGRPPSPMVAEYSVDPVWSPDGRYMIYSGPDIGTTFSVKAVTADAAAQKLPALTLTRGARHLAFLPGGHALVALRGDMQHKNLWLIDLETGSERQLTDLAPDFDIRDFDISPDGREAVLERVQDRSDVVLLDLP